MRAYQNVDGCVNISVREYDIAATTAVQKGQVVCLAEGLVVPAVAAQTGRILGIAAESHSGVEDAMNARENGTVILVYDAPGLIVRCPAPQMAATGGSATTFISTALATFADDDFNGGYIKLVEKGEESTITDAIGKVRRITDFAANTKTMTVESGGTICAGDVYEIYPPLGFAKGNLDENITKLVLTATAALPLKVVQHDRAAGEIGMIAALHALGGEK